MRQTSRGIGLLMMAMVVGVMGLWMLARGQTATAPATRGVTAAAPATEPGEGSIESIVRTKVDNAIRMLEVQDYEGVIKLLAPPEMVSRFMAQGEWNRLVAEFGSGGKANVLLNSLRETKTQRIEITEGGTRARFVRNEPATGPAGSMPAATGPRELYFTLMNGDWSLK